MKEIGLTFLGCLLICGILIGLATYADNVWKITSEAKAKDPTYIEPPRHNLISGKGMAGFYQYHDPDCELCRKARRKEIEHIVDSMLNIRTLNPEP